MSSVWCRSESGARIFKRPRNRFQGMNFASLCSLAGRYDNPLPLRFLAPIDFKNSSSDPITLSETDLNLLRNISTPNAQLALKQEL